MATCGRMAYSSLLAFGLLLSYVTSVDRNNFKTCEQSSFCKRHRALQPGQSSYELQMNSIKMNPTSVEGHLYNKQNGVMFKMELFALIDNTARLKITELEPMYARFEAKEALAGEPKQQSIALLTQDANSISVSFGPNKAVFTAKPFRIDFYSREELVISANARGLLKFEQYRPKKEGQPDGENVDNKDDDGDHDEPGMWDESFKGHADTKPKGPSSVGMDFSFLGFDNLYGLSEHADHLTLRTTKGMDPYRLYNLDVFEYEVDNNMALYGAIPYVVAHSETRTVGVFWLNAAETWVDVENVSEQQNMMLTLVDFVKGQTRVAQTDTHWVSESGIIDVFFMMGPTPVDVFKQYSRLTGVTNLPPLFSLAYHQCRWNYNDQEDVHNVDAGFDEYDIPYDVMWLDIEHTHEKRYFTWDKSKFPTPEDMITNLTAKGRKMVTIVDPHIKRAHGYFVHEEATSKGFYIKNKDGNDYEGWCWPGSSSWLDFLNPEVREYWGSKFALDQYEGSTPSLYIWNDMNEPSVFNGPEVTMHKDAKHYGDWEHRDIHNMYGMLLQMSTYEGLIKRSDGKQRPFLLSRAAFAGSQRYGAVWTGDNTAEWSHLKFSVPMLLSMSIGGVTFCGADVGGFFRNPDAELIVRWYQAGAFQPFFRGHAHIDTRRREPWLFDENTRMQIRDAIRKRYALLPLWYTLFYENEKTGIPPMRPMWVEFSKDTNTYKMENQYMLGNSLLVHPVVESGASKVDVYFPGPDEVWYDAELYDRYDSAGFASIPVNLNKIPHYQRGGTIIPKKNRIRRAASLMQEDPYSLIVALDKTGQIANGTLYMDDGYSYDYRKGVFIFLSIEYHNGVLKSRLAARRFLKVDFITKHSRRTTGNFVNQVLRNGTFMYYLPRDERILNLGKSFRTKAWLERAVILGLEKRPRSIQVESRFVGKRKLDFVYVEEKQVAVIRKPGVNMGEEWTLVLQ